MNTIWNTTCDLPRFKKLDRNLDVENVIIGGGLAGVLTAYFLSKSGRDVVLLEMDTIASKTTMSTTAFITVLQEFCYSEIMAKHNFHYAKQYYDSQVYGLELYNQMSAYIDCDYRTVKSYLFGDTFKDKIVEEYKILKSFGANVYYQEKGNILDKKDVSILTMFNQACFHPLRFIKYIVKDLKIYEETRANKVDFISKTVYTDDFVVKAENIIMATNYPIKNSITNFLKLSQSNSYVLSFKNNEEIDLYCDDLEDGLTARSYNGNMIICGLDHNTGQANSIFKNEQLIHFGKKFGLKDEYMLFNANDTMTNDRIPYASKIRDGIYIITGFNKYGMINSMVSANIIKDIIVNGYSVYEKLFSIKRNVNLLANAGNMKYQLTTIKPSFKRVGSLKCGEGAICFYRGLKKAVYKDFEGELHIISALCSHLKCELSFNSNSKTWDCPCHGSRFDIDGRIISSPAKRKI